MQPIAENTNDFSEIRKSGCVYVDKTLYLYKLLTWTGKKLFFISRPRRFGKSLMLSTLHEIFDGNHALFQGLEISRTDYGWQVHPVIHLNFGFATVQSLEDFELGFSEEVRRGLAAAGFDASPDILPSINLGRAIDFFHEQHRDCVVLIDEYDDPVARALGDLEKADNIRTRLADFYMQMKDRAGKIRFLMMTGVSRFTKMSVFSALSNLTDLTLEKDCATMLGYTEEEMELFFGEHMKAHGEILKMTDSVYRAELKRWYNGYRFSPDSTSTVYNPVSIGITMSRLAPEFRSNWSKTGKSSFLMNYLKRERLLALDPEQLKAVGEAVFDVSDIDNLDPVGILYQTGYLTIDRYHDGLYWLRIPDEEVRRDLSILMAAVVAGKDVKWATQVGVDLRSGNWDDFFLGLKSLYAGVAYGPHESSIHEASFARNLCFLLKGQGFRCQPEVVQANGRCDLVAYHTCGTFIFELKRDQPAAIAMRQAEARQYALPYAAAGTPVWLVGLSFDSGTRLLVDCCYKRFSF